MKTRSLLVCVTLATTLVFHRTAFFGAPVENFSARQLMAKVVEASRTSGFRVRSKLIVTTANSDHREAKQLLIKGRNDGKTATTLYQILWPSELKGHSLLIEKSGSAVSGFLFEPTDTVKKLSFTLMTQPFFGSDLAIEDLAEDFWDWPSQKIVGEETIKEKLCTIVESRPPADAATSYSLVKTWIAPELALPLRVEKYGKNRRLVRRITADRIMKVHDRWTAATIIVDLDGANTRTILEGSKADHDLDLPAADFTLEAIKRGVRNPAAPTTKESDGN
jgi:outer membrane lipoprotein-sorting protein